MHTGDGAGEHIDSIVGRTLLNAAVTGGVIGERVLGDDQLALEGELIDVVTRNIEGEGDNGSGSGENVPDVKSVIDGLD